MSHTTGATRRDPAQAHRKRASKEKGLRREEKEIGVQSVFTINKTQAHTEGKFRDRMRGDQEPKEEDPVECSSLS